MDGRHPTLISARLNALTLITVVALTYGALGPLAFRIKTRGCRHPG